jgi:hypothetical protein
MKTQTRKTSVYVIKTLLHMAQPGARLLIVCNGAFLVNPSTRDHWYVDSAVDVLLANGWITAPTEVGPAVTECFITDTGRDVAAAIEAAKRGYTQLELEQVLEGLEAAAAQEQEPDEVTTGQTAQVAEEAQAAEEAAQLDGEASPRTSTSVRLAQPIQSSVTGIQRDLARYAPRLFQVPHPLAYQQGGRYTTGPPPTHQERPRGGSRAA